MGLPPQDMYKFLLDEHGKFLEQAAPGDLDPDALIPGESVHSFGGAEGVYVGSDANLDGTFTYVWKIR